MMLPEKIIKHFKYLGLHGAMGEDRIGEVLESEYRRRLTRYEHTNRLFREKYGMTFDEFEQSEIVKKKGFIWEVETDSDKWEMAIDGIQNMSRGSGNYLKNARMLEDSRALTLRSGIGRQSDHVN